MIISHYKAGTGAILLETQEEDRATNLILTELPSAPVAALAAPNGPIRDGRTGAPVGQGLAEGYKWLSSGPGRVLVCYDWHVMANNPGAWRALIEALPAIRCPKGAKPGDPASLVTFVAPAWELSPQNPLRGQIPIVRLPLPTRAQLAARVTEVFGIEPDPDHLNALSGLTAAVAEQAVAECLAARGAVDSDHLRGERRRALRDAGLEIWPSVERIGGLDGLRRFCEEEVFPWVQDEQLAVRRILCAGVPGVGKSYCARWIGYRLGCEVARLSIPSLKGSLVGQSEANLRRALRAVDALAAEAPLVLVIDEIDAAIQRHGLDSGVSSGLFSELLTWLQESQSQAVVIATLNHLDNLDAALESRFAARFFFDLPSQAERKEVALVHLMRIGVAQPERVADWVAAHTEGFSSREIAEHAVPSLARRGRREPDERIVREVCEAICPASQTQAEQLAAMRKAASSLRKANSPHADRGAFSGRRVI